jgi:hypothetical protein
MANTVTVTVDTTTGVAIATVKLDGVAATGEVRWLSGTPWRPAPNGVARFPYRDPEEHDLSAARYDPPEQLEVTGRVSVDGRWVESAAVLVDPPADGPDPEESPDSWLIGPDGLRDGAATTPKIADGAVTKAKIAGLTADIAELNQLHNLDTNTLARRPGNVITAGASACDETHTAAAIAAAVAAGATTANPFVVKTYPGVIWDQTYPLPAGVSIDAQAMGGSEPQRILAYPHFGTLKSQFVDLGQDLTYMFYLGAGESGVIRNLWFLANGSSWANLNTMMVRIYTGLGTVADKANPTAGKAAGSYTLTSIPLGTLLGAHYGAAPAAGVAVNTAFLDYQFGAGNDAAIQLRLPIPFSNGCLIQLWTTVPQTISYAWASYDSGALPAWEFADWRLRTGLHDADIPLGGGGTFLNEIGKPGMMIGFFAALRHTADADPFTLTFLENNLSLWPDGADTSGSPTWQTSGLEDVFGTMPYYFAVTADGAHLIYNQDYGCTAIHDPGEEGVNMPGYVCAYRWFAKDPVMWRNGCVGKVPNTEAAGSISGMTAHLMAIYYAP